MLDEKNIARLDDGSVHNGELFVIGIELNWIAPHTIVRAAEQFEDDVAEAHEHYGIQDCSHYIDMTESMNRAQSVPFLDHTLGLLEIQQPRAAVLGSRLVNIRPLPAPLWRLLSEQVARQSKEIARCACGVEKLEYPSMGFGVGFGGFSFFRHEMAPYHE